MGSLITRGICAIGIIAGVGERSERTIRFGSAARSMAVQGLSIQVFFQYRSRQRHARLALRYGQPLEQQTIQRNIIRGHARGRESLLEPSPNSVTIERNH